MERSMALRYVCSLLANIGWIGGTASHLVGSEVERSGAGHPQRACS